MYLKEYPESELVRSAERRDVWDLLLACVVLMLCRLLQLPLIPNWHGIAPIVL